VSRSCLRFFATRSKIRRQIMVDKAAQLQSVYRVAGASLFSYVADPAELQRRARLSLTRFVPAGFAMGIGTAYDLDRVYDARLYDAHRAVEGRVQGKLYLTPKLVAT